MLIKEKYGLITVTGLVTAITIKLHSGFSQMGVQVSSRQPLIRENCFIFHMLPYKLFIQAGTIADFGCPLFKLLYFCFFKLYTQLKSVYRHLLLKIPFLTIDIFPGSCICRESTPTNMRIYFHVPSKGLTTTTITKSILCLHLIKKQLNL